MNPSKDFEEINFNLFNFSNDQDQQNMRDPVLINLIARMA